MPHCHSTPHTPHSTHAPTRWRASTTLLRTHHTAVGQRHSAAACAQLQGAHARAHACTRARALELRAYQPHRMALVAHCHAVDCHHACSIFAALHHAAGAVTLQCPLALLPFLLPSSPHLSLPPNHARRATRTRANPERWRGGGVAREGNEDTGEAVCAGQARGGRGQAWSKKDRGQAWSKRDKV